MRRTWAAPAIRGGNVAVRFVLRCGGLPEGSIPDINASDVVCAPNGSTMEGRSLGPIFALNFWFAHACSTYPSAQFIGKADDDSWIHLPSILHALRAIPRSRQVGAILTPHASVGSVCSLLTASGCGSVQARDDWRCWCSRSGCRSLVTSTTTTLSSRLIAGALQDTVRITKLRYILGNIME